MVSFSKSAEDSRIATSATLRHAHGAMSNTLLKLSCPDRVGLLAQITAFIARHGGNLAEVQQFTDSRAGWFFTRMEIESGSMNLPIEEFKALFGPLADELKAEWTIRSMQQRPRAIILVSKIGH